MLTAATAGASNRFPTTLPARIGDQRYVRASYRITRAQTERTLLAGRVKVLSIDATTGSETAGEIEIERCSRIVAGVEQPLIPPGERLLLQRVDGRVELLRGDGQPLPTAITRWTRLVVGLRGGSDDLDLWQRPDDGSLENWPVDQAKVRQLHQAVVFDMAAVRSESRAVRTGDGQYDLAARLRIAKYVGKAGGRPGQSYIADGNFAVECRWRINPAGLERFRRTRWLIHDGKRSEPDAPLTMREVEIIGIESATPDPWWVKSEDEVAEEAMRWAATEDPLLGFYCLREHQQVLGEIARRGATPAAFDFERDEITHLLKIAGFRE